MPTIAASSHFTQIHDWSERKHAILQSYLPTFCQALSRQARGSTIWYVDGFAGAGIYRDSENPDAADKFGSPVIAARITEQLGYPIRCLNVEENTKNFESLQRESSQFQHVSNIHGDFNLLVDGILATVAGGPAFFFLDPFGTKALPMEGLVDRIAMRTKPTDMLLRYATEAVRRLAGSYEKDLKRGGANARNLDKWFRGQEWRKIIDSHTGEARDDALLNYYLEQLVSISNGRLQFACSYPIRSNEGKIKYHLVFATGHRLGMKLMSDILFKAESKYIEDSTAHQKRKELQKRNGQISMFDDLEIFDEHTPDPNILQAEKMNQLKASLLELGHQDHRLWEFEELFYTLLQKEWFARILEKDLRLACKELHASGKIKRLSSGRGWSKGIEFILNS